jgi:uncharacterized protein (TIGR02996 family)
MADQEIPAEVDWNARKLWAIRHWCADVALNPQELTANGSFRGWRALDASSKGELQPEAISMLAGEQEAALIEALKTPDPATAHLIYADWLDERGIGSAAIGHRLMAERFQWCCIGSQVVFKREHIVGMYNAFQGFLSPAPGHSGKQVGTWLVPLDGITGGGQGDLTGVFTRQQMPQAEYIGSYDFQTVIEKIYRVSWRLRRVRVVQKESTK